MTYFTKGEVQHLWVLKQKTFAIHVILEVGSTKKSKRSNHRVDQCIESILSQPKGKFSDQSIIRRWGQSLTFSDKPSKITNIILDRKSKNNILKINSGIFKFVSCRTFRQQKPGRWFANAKIQNALKPIIHFFDVNSQYLVDK